jgi:catechol 2,3-dioxygenase-like lactoylglutathione lyase family enzyme
MKRTAAVSTAVSVGVLALCVLAWAAEVGFSTKTIHIGMVVSDLDQSVAFYKDVVGMVQTDRTQFDVNSQFGKDSGLTDGAPIHIEILKLGSGAEATELKLMTFGDKAKKNPNEYIHSQTGIQYLTIQVTDIGPSLERVKAHNIRLLGKTPVTLPDGRLFLLFQDPDGTFVEIIGPKK